MFFGAGNQIRTDDLVITNDVLCQLSHTSKSPYLDDSYIISNKNRFVKPFFKKNQKNDRFDFLHYFLFILPTKIGEIDAIRNTAQTKAALE